VLRRDHEVRARWATVARSTDNGRRPLLRVLAYENIAKSDPGGAGMVDLITSDRRVGLAIGFTWLLVRRLQPPGSVGGGTAERYAGVNLTI
jgi:hypothetical protein